MHLNIANRPHITFAPEAVDAAAATLNEDEEDGLTYIVHHDPKGTGRSYIEVLDEDGEHIADF